MNKEKKHIVKVGELEVNMDEVVRDVRGVEDIAADALQEMEERRIRQWKPKLNILAHAADISEWDNILLDRYYPLYTDIKYPPSGEGLDLEAYQAKLSLQIACKGLVKQLTYARDLLNFSIKLFGRDKELDYGPSIYYSTVNTAMLTGFYADNLDKADKALSYVESQLTELLFCAYFGKESVKDFEKKTLHAGALIFLAMEIAEAIKMCCFNFYNAGKLPATEYADFPKVETEVGMGTVDRSKPVLLFMGDNFLPAWFAIEYMKKNELEEKVEIGGVGAVGHDIPRFYKRGKILTSGAKARKVVKAGIPDVIVVSESSYNFDVVEEAKKVDAKVIAFGYKVNIGLEDRSEDSVEDIIKDVMEKDLPGVQITIPEKAGELAVKLVNKIKEEGKRRESYLESEEEERIKEDKYLMRAGRGPLSGLEWRDLTFGFVLGGNAPGMVFMVGDGSYSGLEKEISEMARYFLERNCLVAVAGDIAADVAKYYDEDEKKYIYEQYIAAGLLKGLVNLGGLTAISHIPPSAARGTMIGSGYTPKANWTQIVDYQYTRLPLLVIMWGAATEEMYTMAAGFVRHGLPVIVGPSGFKFKRYLMGNKYDRSKWWMYDGITGERKEIEPCPTHMIVPVETKEEAIAMAAKLFHKPLALRDPRLASLEFDNETNKNFFGDYSDDWHLYVRADQELHVMRKMEMLRALEREHGWEIRGTRAVKAKHPSGEIMSMGDYTQKYGIQLGRYSTLVPRLITRT